MHGDILDSVKIFVFSAEGTATEYTEQVKVESTEVRISKTIHDKSHQASFLLSFHFLFIVLCSSL